MKTKKRFLAVVLAAALLVAGLTGCKDALRGVAQKISGSSGEVQEEDTTRWADATADPLIIQGIADASAKFDTAMVDGTLYAVFNGIWSRSTDYFTAPTGSLNIISLHDRHSRRGHGFFLPGGERLVSSKGEEVFVYFEKGDMKPPLAVYFSGYRTQEGFEGYYMMRGFGCPFILVTDPRSEGGAFYLGDSEFEQMITDYVTDKLNELGLTKDELVLSGASMGTFGSLYYGSKLSPHALLLAKPLANMGNVARNERILRAGGFATSLDILMKNYDNLSDEAIEQLNNRMWDRFDSADWSQTKFIISYLYEDDYDPDGYPSILSHLKSSGVEVYGKGSHGRHTDNSANVMAWFKSQYNNLLHDDFSR